MKTLTSDQQRCFDSNKERLKKRAAAQIGKAKTVKLPFTSNEDVRSPQSMFVIFDRKMAVVDFEEIK